MNRPQDTPERHTNDRLDSWGEIATYLRRGIRSVRRWEQYEGLPVHRHLHLKSGSVYAFKSELDDWWNNRRPHIGPSKEKPRSRWTVWGWWVPAIVLALGAMLVVLVKPLMPGRRATISSVRAIAVLPFDDLSPNPQHDVFAEAMTEELITSLAQVIPMRIVSLSSVIRYKHAKEPLREIGRELNVDAVVRGSVQRDGNQVSVTVRVIDVRTNRHIWAGSYEGSLNNFVSFEAKTARTVAHEIQTTLVLGQSE